jgi:hypothetical protein
VRDLPEDFWRDPWEYMDLLVDTDPIELRDLAWMLYKELMTLTKDR